MDNINTTSNYSNETILAWQKHNQNTIMKMNP